MPINALNMLLPGIVCIVRWSDDGLSSTTKKMKREKIDRKSLATITDNDCYLFLCHYKLHLMEPFPLSLQL